MTLEEVVRSIRPLLPPASEPTELRRDAAVKRILRSCSGVPLDPISLRKLSLPLVERKFLRTVLKTAWELGMIQSPLQVHVCIPRRTYTPCVPKWEAAVRVVRELRPGSVKAAAMLGLYAGLRVCESSSLRWEDVDLVEKKILVRRSKNGRGRIVLIPDVLCEFLRRWKATRGGQWVTHPNPDSLRRRWNRAMKRLGLRWRLHDLRHLHASWIIRRGVDVVTVATRLGHSSPVTTLRYYAHFIPGAQEEAVRVLEG